MVNWHAFLNDAASGPLQGFAAIDLFFDQVVSSTNAWLSSVRSVIDHLAFCLYLR
jgi:hypothetical protein